jgi:hypothetical protein
MIQEKGSSFLSGMWFVILRIKYFEIFLGLLTMPTMEFQHQLQALVCWEIMALLVILRLAILWKRKLLLYSIETVEYHMLSEIWNGFHMMMKEVWLIRYILEL